MAELMLTDVSIGDLQTIPIDTILRTMAYWNHKKGEGEGQRGRRRGIDREREERKKHRGVDTERERGREGVTWSIYEVQQL